MKKLIIIIVLIIVFGLGYWALSANLIPEAETNETADWETYRNEESGYEIKYPASFVSGTANCYHYSSGEKLNDEKSVRFEADSEGMYVHICSYGVNYNELSGIDMASAVDIDNHSAYVDKFIIKGGGRAYYYIEKDNNNSIFIDAFWAYPENSTENEDLEVKEKIIDEIISTFKFI